jgi:peptidyl-tRNA hydrolase, PTH1 family
MRLVVGLGNPGPEYVGTRHNIGFQVLDELAARLGWIAKPDDFNRLAKSRFSALTLDGSVNRASGDSEKVMLLKPTTYMNLSGNSVQAASSFFQLAPTDILIVLDDVALPAGRLRIRASGSSGGHNGLKDIQRALATDQYPRLRIGIDSPPGRVPQKDYVLGQFSSEQRAQIQQTIPRACGAIVTWIDQGITAAMNQFNAAEDEKKC